MSKVLKSSHSTKHYSDGGVVGVLCLKKKPVVKKPVVKKPATKKPAR